MVNTRKVGTTRLLVAFLLAGGVVATQAQSRQALSMLTVPMAALPSGCALSLPAPAPDPPPITSRGTTVIPAMGRSQFPTNPWSGTDRKIVAAVHMAIDPTRRRPLPDVPPTASRGAASVDVQWADNILEAYHAAYASALGGQVEVFAVTFNDVKLAAAPESVSAMLNPPRGFTSRVVWGATVVRVSAPTSGDCARAVDRYVQALK